MYVCYAMYYGIMYTYILFRLYYILINYIYTYIISRWNRGCFKVFFSTTEWHQIGELRIIPSSHWLSHGKSLGCYCHKWYERMYWCISCTSTMSAESIYSYIICIILYNYIIYTIITSTKGRCLWHWVYHRVIGFFTGRNCRRKIRSDPGADQLASIPGDPKNNGF